jgi:hypothetical protein
MVQYACANGLTHLTATTLWENRPARALLRRLQFQTSTSNGHEIEQQLELDCRARGESPSVEPVTKGQGRMTSPYLTSALAQANVDDLRRAAEARSLAHHRAEPLQP